MSPRVAVVVLMCGVLGLFLAYPAEKTLGTGSGENDDLILTMTLHLDPADIKEMVTSDLGGHFILAEVKVQPKYGKTVTVAADDFLLTDTDHNDKSKPFTANQVAGPSLVIRRGPSDDPQDTAKKKRNRPTFSAGPIMTSPGVKITPPVDPAQAKSHEDGAEKDTPLEKSLAARILPEGQTDKPAEGLLFFAIEKAKMKDLQLTYGGKDNRIVLKFK